MIKLCKNRHYSGVFYSTTTDKNFVVLLSRPEGKNELDGWHADILTVDIASGAGTQDIMSATSADTEEDTQRKVLKFINKLLQLSGLQKGRIDFIPVHGSYDRLMVAIAQSKKTNIPKWLYHVT